GGWTPLGLPGQTAFTIPDAVVIRGSHTRVITEHPGLILNFQNTVTVQNSARLRVESDLHLGPLASLNLTTSGILEVAGTLTSDIPLTVTSGALLSVGQPFTPQQPVVVNTGGIFHVTGEYTSVAPLSLNGGG